MNKEQIPARRMAVQPLPDGTELVLHSLDYADWQHIKRESLSSYKRARIKTWTENLDLLPEDMRQGELREAFKRAEDITIDTLPRKTVDMPTGEKDNEGNDILNPAEVDYVSWWLSETDDGKSFALWLSARHDPSQTDITRDSVANSFMSAPLELEQAAQTVGEMSTSELAKNS